MEVLLIRRSKHRHVSSVKENDWVLSGSVSAYHIFHASDLLRSVAWNDEKGIWMTISYYQSSTSTTLFVITLGIQEISNGK